VVKGLKDKSALEDEIKLVKELEVKKAAGQVMLIVLCLHCCIEKKMH